MPSPREEIEDLKTVDPNWQWVLNASQEICNRFDIQRRPGGWPKHREPLEHHDIATLIMEEFRLHQKMVRQREFSS